MVFLLFFILIFFIVIIIYSKITIQVDNLKISSKNNKHINDNYKFIIKLYAFSKILIFKKVYNNNKIKRLGSKINIDKKIKNIKMQKIIEELNKNSKVDAKFIKLFFKDVLEIININLKIELGTKDSASTAILVGTISTIISIILRSKIKNVEKQYYKIIPNYVNENTINIDISGIFGIKVIHIINIIYILLKEKGEKSKKKVHLAKTKEQNSFLNFS